MKTLIFCFNFCLAGFILCEGQSSQPLILMGEPMPQLTIKNLLNYPVNHFPISALKGKWIILDFWHTRCVSCIQSFPKLHVLQKQFDGQIQILLIGYEPKPVIEKYLISHQKMTGQATELPIVCNDTQLKAIFKPPSFPHLVWIDKKGFVRYITYGDELTSENIQAVLAGHTLEVDQKNDTPVECDYSKPLVTRGNCGEGQQIKAYSMLTTAGYGEPTISGYFKTGDSNSYIHAIACPMKGLFQVAFNDYLNEFNIPENRTDIRADDTTKYVWMVNGKTQWKNLYSYQLQVPYKSGNELKQMMQSDLMRYFGMEAHMEKRIGKCWVMTAEDTTLLISKGGKFINEISDKDFSMTIQNAPDSLVSRWFAYYIFQQSPFPFVNDIHMSHNIDLRLSDINCDSAESVIQALKAYKINIRLEDHPVDILMISDDKLKRH